MDEALRKKLSNLRVLFYDFDGVMTDNRVLVDQNGIESVFVNRSDGLAVSRLTWSSSNPSVATVDDKGEIIRKYLEDNSISRESTLFIGNDLNDLPAFNAVGVKACPADAYEIIKDSADIIFQSRGGAGVIRELMDLLPE